MSGNSGKHDNSTSTTAKNLGTKFDAGRETFVAKVQVRDTPRKAIFTVVGGEEAGQVISIPNQNVVTLGRSPECNIRFDDVNLSRLHAHLMHVGEEYIFSDARSKNGSYVNDIRVEDAVVLRDGDRVQLGSSVRLRFTLVDDAEEKALRDLYYARRRGGLLAAFERADQRGDLLEDLLQAREFQQRILTHPPYIPGVVTEVIYRPLDLVGGDFYQVFPLPDGTLRVFVADATGHGVKASLTTVLISSEYELVKREAGGPAQVLTALNQRMATHFTHLSVHFTAICADFDFKLGLLRFSSAAHPAPCLVRGNTSRELETGGPFIGLMADVEFPEWTHQILRGDHIALYTDGAVEAFNAANEPFGEERLLEALRCAVAAQKPLGVFLTMVLEQFLNGLPLADDLTFVDIGWSG
ncbi:MAG: SpoIIE family protein phosphatase [Polyangiaceae bacterium]|nr:SpoIIE family protein phosphatase [Polyangiaceae bacterium]